jgi:hypothetical protein
MSDGETVLEGAPAKNLYWFQTEPGDRDHLESHWFDEGVIEATPAEIEALDAELKHHRNEYKLQPLAKRIRSIDSFRAAMGGAMAGYHSEVKEDEPCEADAPFIARFHE